MNDAAGLSKKSRGGGDVVGRADRVPVAELSTMARII